MSFTIAFCVDRSPDEVFAVNDVRSWWPGPIEGGTDDIGGEFTYRHGDEHRSMQRITELAPGKRVAGRVVDVYLDFAADKTEWTGTEITFDIERRAARPTSVSPTSASPLSTRASTRARTPGTTTSAPTCGTGS